MPAVVRVLRATQAALDKLGRRDISDDEAEQLPRNRHAVVANVRGDRERGQPPERRLLIGHTDGGRTLTLVIEETLDPETWLVVTGWDSTRAERRLLEQQQ
jgi:hypothetical protein